VEEAAWVAALWKAANSLPGLTAKTIPDEQWFAWAQYAQIGFMFFTASRAVGKSVVLLAATGTNPELKPLAKGTHGFWRVDCVTV
jgi:hypothetical protein